MRHAPRLDDASKAPGGDSGDGGAATWCSGVGGPVSHVEVSYDDGATWRRVPLAPTGDGWVAPVVYPDSGYVSLRVKAIAADGNGVKQTIIRAYGLRAR